MFCICSSHFYHSDENMKETDFGIEQTGVKTIRNQICNECIWIILGISFAGILGSAAFLHRKLALARIPHDSCSAQNSDRRSTLAFSLNILISEGATALP